MISLISFLINACEMNASQCHDVRPNENFSGEGYILFQKDSQDGRRELLFFPVCFKANDKDSNLLDHDFKAGISFNLPLTSKLYKKLSTNALKLTDFSKQDPRIIFYKRVSIQFNRPENSNFLYRKPPDTTNFQITLSSGNKNLSLNYFVSHKSNIKE